MVRGCVRLVVAGPAADPVVAFVSGLDVVRIGEETGVDNVLNVIMLNSSSLLFILYLDVN